MNTVSRLASVVCVGLGLVGASTEVAAERILIVHDEDTGVSRTYTPPIGVFTLSEVGEILRVTVGEQFGEVSASVLPGFWFMSFVAPPGERLSPGVYRNAGCLSPYRTGRAPSMEIADNPVCLDGDTVWGEFAIRQLDYDAAGAVRGVELTFTQRVGSASAPALTGELRIDTNPLSLTVDSPAAFAWGRIAQENHGDTSLFTLTGTTAGIDYTASVIKDLWSIAITPPPGMLLEAGRTYTTRNFADGRSAGLLILRGADVSQSCADASGLLKVRAIETATSGEVTGLHADFHYKCTLNGPPLRGTIRYHL
ncbi:hypothetical protein [Luteimonas granuli]|uniref:Uncharacterized protein n=1 Tax=Luteimonas granuli TaxID=1176533 RepID=A0A518N3V6_9GAMM|nr:hypothetical protein [Luteimonas granuli]QDW66557.1 hypothetical protein FPZ22_06310 [Luteimonas granuli]